MVQQFYLNEESMNLKDYMHFYVYCGASYNSQFMGEKLNAQVQNIE